MRFDKKLGYSVPVEEVIKRVEQEANAVKGDTVPTIEQIKEAQTTPQQVQQEEQVSEQTTEEQEQIEQPEVQTKQKETPQESFGNLKRKSQQLERERDEAMRRLAAYEQQLLQQPKDISRYEGDKYTKPQPAQEEDINIGDDDLAEGKHLRLLKRQIKSLEEKINQTHQFSNENFIETKLKNMYPDFDSVVTIDNVKELASSEPEIAATINANQDLYSKSVSAYKMIKKLGINQAQLQQEQEMAKKNMTKPRPLTSLSPQQGSSPLAKANEFAQGLTEDLKKQLYKEMMEAKKAR